MCTDTLSHTKRERGGGGEIDVLAGTLMVLDLLTLTTIIQTFFYIIIIYK